MTDLNALVVRTLQLRRLAEKVADFAATVDAQRIETEQAIREQMTLGDKKVAKLHAVPVGWAQMKNAPGGPTKATVRDADALLAWVEANRPGEIVGTVRESYRRALLATARREGQAVDQKTGEAIPGIEVGPAGPVLAFHIEDDALAALESDAGFIVPGLRSLLTEGDT